ncbi:general secretion pathway protein GspB [Gayadomonas joobiniege]|uniref:general secretion pathway protein GspB n=1 Tax=Gayadomonas joobiniege TaxID=1234606 RepID=UPI00037A53FB|nr:general secretion pathway protein GspB [Gayadomonas joobiniege]
MSFLLDALNKKSQSDSVESGVPQAIYADSSEHEHKSGRAKTIVSLLLIGITAFICGYYFASHKPERQNQPTVPSTVLSKIQPEAGVTEHSEENNSQRLATGELQQQVVGKSDQAFVVKSTDTSTLADIQIGSAVAEQTNFAQSQTEIANQQDSDPANQKAKQVEQTSSQPTKQPSSTTQNDAVVNKPSNNQKTEAEPLSNTQSASENSGIDSELLKRFQQAVDQTMSLSDEQISKSLGGVNKVPALTSLPDSFGRLIPNLDFQMHIYSSEAKQRWVKVNNKIVREGQIIAPGLKLEKIDRQHVELSYQNKSFSLPALSSW